MNIAINLLFLTTLYTTSILSQVNSSIIYLLINVDRIVESRLYFRLLFITRIYTSKRISLVTNIVIQQLLDINIKYILYIILYYIREYTRKGVYNKRFLYIVYRVVIERNIILKKALTYFKARFITFQFFLVIIVQIKLLAKIAAFSFRFNVSSRSSQQKYIIYLLY